MENLNTLSRPAGSNLCHLAILFLLLLLSPLSHGNRLYSQYELKAAYIFNFLKFIEWPDEDSGEMDQIRVCAYSGAPILPHLKTLERRQVRELGISIHVYDSAEDIAQCQLIYLDTISANKRRDILSQVKGQPVLTVGNQSHYSDDHEIINFFEEDERLRFDINYKKARQSGIKISSRLLKLARISEQPE